DAALEPKAMDSKSLDDNHLWAQAAVMNVSPRKTTPQTAGPNRIIAEHRPVGISRAGDGWLVDMGQVFTGWFEMEMPQLPAGTEIRIDYSDFLADNGFETQGGETDVFIADGTPGRKFCNKFHHHAYRYALITGLEAKPEASSIRGLQISNIDLPEATFSCSDNDLNAIHSMIDNTLKCLTFSGYMVDCPHLERAGYGGDGNSSTEILQTIYNVNHVYTNWLQGWADSMQDGGMMPNAAPSATAGGGGGPYWNAFIAFAPWRTHVSYDDRRIITTYYPLMKEWIGFVDRHRDADGLLRRWDDPYYAGWYLGDWIAPEGVDVGGESVDLVSNCVISETLGYMSHIAAITGNETEAAQWQAGRESLNAAIHRKFYHPETGTYGTGSQLDLCYPMLVGAVPPELVATVTGKVLEFSATKHNGHMAGG
ncbi:MAG: family 78 glycoside hydrolase catalytic domain, partial [Muribaculaceae bacterium]|nr:family 78 glycoside hydrolase catalytic domain [Muribaculaceae bacterium]